MNWSVVRGGLQTLHLWAGIILSIPFVLLGISGSILMFQPEAPRWSLPHAAAAGEHQSLEAILRAARAAKPDAIATRVAMPEAHGEPATIRFDPADARRGDNYRGDLVFVDPVSLDVLGQYERPRPAAIFGLMRTLHATLYVRTISDRTFVGWMGIALILMCISGLVLWWPRTGQWYGALGVKAGARGYRLHRDLHSAIGFWTSALLIVVSFSGLYLAFPRTFRDVSEFVFPMGQIFSEPDAEAIGIADAPPFELDGLVARALAHLPDARLRGVEVPDADDDIVVMSFAPLGTSSSAYQMTVSVEPQSGLILYVDDPRNYAVGERFVLWQRWLHSGLGLGLVWRVLVFISGFLPLFFAVTGIWMWALKRNRRRKMAADTIPVPAE